MSKDNYQKSPINPILTDPEQARANANGNLFSERLAKLWVAWNADFREVIFTLGKHVENQSELPWLESFTSLSDIIARLGKSFEFIVSDCEGLKEFGGEVLSYEYGLQCILDSARIALTRSAGSNSPMPESEDEAGRLVIEIQSCMMALIAQGYTQKAADLGRLAGACFWIKQHNAGEDEDTLKAGSRREYGKDIDRLRILLFLHSQLAQGNIPTKKALRQSAVPNKDQSNFTGLLRGMTIQPLLPDETKGRKSLKDSSGTLHQGWFFRNPPKGCEPLEEHENHILVERSLKPSGNRQMVDVEVRRIKKSLGPVYHMLLIQFGLRVLQSTNDLRVFEYRLAKLGLALK